MSNFAEHATEVDVVLQVFTVFSNAAKDNVAWRVFTNSTVKTLCDTVKNRKNVITTPYHVISGNIFTSFQC